MLANTEQAIIEGWPEFIEAVFSNLGTPPYNVTTVVDDVDGNNPRPLGPPPLNRGESVEGAFANGLWAIFRNHVVTSAISANANLPESVNGNILTASPWVQQAAVRDRFLTMIWNPFRDLRPLSDATSTDMFNRIRARNAGIWHQLQAELQAFNMAMTPPTVTSISPSTGPASGGQAITVRGTNFVTGMQVNFFQAPATVTPATSVVVTNSTTLTAVTPPGTVGSANVTVVTRAGTSTLVTPYTYT